MQKHRLVERIIESYGNDLSGIFGMWGLAFKPGTDDVREASSAVIRALVARGAIIKAYDPSQWNYHQRNKILDRQTYPV